MHHCHIIDDRMKIGMVAFYLVEPYASVDFSERDGSFG